MTDDDEFVSISRACEITGLSKAEIARREAAGKFPLRIPLPGLKGCFRNSRRVYLLSELKKWMRDQIQAARGTDAPSKK
jgi:hypothetical protein